MTLEAILVLTLGLYGLIVFWWLSRAIKVLKQETMMIVTTLVVVVDRIQEQIDLIDEEMEGRDDTRAD